MLPAHLFYPQAFKDKIQKCMAAISASTPGSPECQKLVAELRVYTKDALYVGVEKELQTKVTVLLEPMEKLAADKPATATDLLIQIPSSAHLAQMTGMAAGANEDQAQRLNHMVQSILAVRQTYQTLPVTNSSEVNLGAEWNALFAAINAGDKNKAIQLFKAIPADNWLLKPLLSVHSANYLLQIITWCIEALSLSTANKPGVVVKEKGDLKLTPKTFEILMHDIGATLLSKQKIKFSFGLPSHHGYSSVGRGFCILNKTAVLLSHIGLSNPKALRYVIVGTDVNRDDGLCDILMHLAYHMKISHIDIYDSRVYPYHNAAKIDEILKIAGQTYSKTKAKFWKQNELTYYAVDLSEVVRTDKTPVHPALTFALSKIKASLETAQKSASKVMILLPTGWDSHQDETAPCGRYTVVVNKQLVDKTDAGKTRFNDSDLRYFYAQILVMYKKYNAVIEGIYWGLEGGYNKAMYQKQIQLMLEVVASHLQLPQANTAAAAASGANMVLATTPPGSPGDMK